jgi:sugar lactone lactonase YvrE
VDSALGHLDVLDVGQMTLGEGPTWDESTASLIWVDILGRQVHTYQPSSDEHFFRSVQGPVSLAVPRSRGGLILAAGTDFMCADERLETQSSFASLPDVENRVRLNDGKCDRMGRLWAGTMSYDNSAGDACLYLLTADGVVTPVLDDLTVSNGLAWSLDDLSMFLIDSPTHDISKFDFNPETGEIANRRTAFSLPAEYGVPDGMTIDSDGYLWIAFFEGWAVRRFSQGGELERTVQLPVEKPTSCAFGGDDLSTLFITSASHNLSTSQDQAGSVFAYETHGISGVPESPFSG